MGTSGGKGASDHQVLTVMEAAERLRIGRAAAYRAVAQGSIPAFKVGGSWRIPRRALEDLVEIGVHAGEQANGEGRAARGLV
jgi:excisionase family DNA binding protein